MKGEMLSPNVMTYMSSVMIYDTMGFLCTTTLWSLFAMGISPRGLQGRWCCPVYKCFNGCHLLCYRVSMVVSKGDSRSLTYDCTNHDRIVMRSDK